MCREIYHKLKKVLKDKGCSRLTKGGGTRRTSRRCDWILSGKGVAAAGYKVEDIKIA